MLYDKNPHYPHYDQLPYAKEPWKALYVFQRLFTTLALVPFWATAYAVLPRRYRPRPSWSLKQIINVNFTRRIFKVTEVAGVTWHTRNPSVAPDPSSLKETRFIWVDPLLIAMRTGIVLGDVDFKQVGCYIWPLEEPNIVKKTKATVNLSMENMPHVTSCSSSSSPLPNSNLGQISSPNSPYSKSSIDLDLEDGEVPLVGIYMHGSGYCHMSAHETSRTSRIPRGLIKNGILHKVYAVEYRLLQVAPFPAAVQDAAAVYAHVVHHYSFKQRKCKIVLIGDSSGGNLVLSLARWIRDEGHLPLPHGLILLSPSCDTSHALPETLSSYIPRPNANTDYLVDTPEPRALLHRTFLGFKRNEGPDTLEDEIRLMEVVHSEYVSPCSPFALKRWGHDVIQDPEGTHASHFRSHIPLELARDAENWVTSQYKESSRFTKLFGDFPKSLVVLGDAERLVREVRSLFVAMKKDGVDVSLHVVPDGVHDVLIMNPSWWDRKAIEDTWSAIENWAKSIYIVQSEHSSIKCYNI